MNKLFSKGDMVRHPVTGYIGIIIGQDLDRGTWTVSWFSAEDLTPLKDSNCTAEYSSALCLMNKAVLA